MLQRYGKSCSKQPCITTCLKEEHIVKCSSGLVHLEFKTTFLLVDQVSIQSAIHFLAWKKKVSTAKVITNLLKFIQKIFSVNKSKYSVSGRKCEGHDDKTNGSPADVPQAFLIVISHKPVLPCGSQPVGLGPLGVAEFIVRGLYIHMHS